MSWEVRIMKSRTSFFKFSLLRKDMLRFAPAWIILSVCLLMTTLVSAAFGTADNVASALSYGLMASSVGNLFYGMLVAQLLFGDLFKTRLCNALHALPVRRESWFLTHLIAGLLYGLIPVGLVGGIYVVLLSGYRTAAILWMAGYLAQYVFFFSVAVFCAMIVGSRFAMVVVYGILNFLAPIALWLFVALYQPLLPGVEIDTARWMDFCPVYEFTSRCWFQIEEATGALRLGDGYVYAGICLLIGAGLLVAALFLYRKRQLERAGDFLVVRFTSPVFLVLYTFCVAAVFHGFSTIFTLLGDAILSLLIRYTLLSVGLTVGFFTGMMLLRRTARVIRWKTLGGYALVMTAFYMSVAVTFIDPLGLTRWTPNPALVRSVSVNAYEPDEHSMSDPEAIEAVIQIHKEGIQSRWDQEEGTRVELRYVMKSGRVVYRTYYIPENAKTEQVYFRVMSQPENVLDNSLASEKALVAVLRSADSGDEIVTEKAKLGELAAAVIADAREGNLCQEYEFYRDSDYRTVELRTENDWHYIRVTKAATRTWAWLQVNLPESVTEK